jgi:hypothetical protein
MSSGPMGPKADLRSSEMDVGVKGWLVVLLLRVHGGCAGAGRPARDGNDDWSL